MVRTREERKSHRRESSSSSLSSSRSRSREKCSSRKSNNYRKRSRRSRSRSRSHRHSRTPSAHRRTRYYGTRENPYATRVVGVFGLSSITNESKLVEIFSPFGAIEHVSIIHDAKTGNSRGFGFIYYSQIDQATAARKNCNGMSLDGKRIRVDYSITKRAHTPTPGIYMGSSKSHENDRRGRSRSSARHSSNRRRSHRYRSRSYTRSRSRR